MSRLRRIGSLLPLALLAGCGLRVDPVPAAARTQQPQAAPRLAWVAPTARCTLTAPGTRVSCAAVVRCDGLGGVRLALVTDEGPLLADVAVAADGAVQVHHLQPSLTQQVPTLARLVRQAWAQPTESPGAWKDDVWCADAGPDRRWYGGDPVLLRIISGPDGEVLVEDWRPLPDGPLLPRSARLRHGPVEVALVLGPVRTTAAPSAGQR